MTPWHDLVVGGLLITPFVGYALAALLGTLVLWPLLRRVRVLRGLARTPFAASALYLCVLALLLVLA
ncbi:DUF1656 domain-containing protein [uncultured Methylobacterium sp.]|jgi:predicted PurR-regulated permease PerM|uniref:DUF1656 domain-containing protein n=1 Tax=uncultured Methylobacterium sp. TaxID=157278 RepID=UPI00261B0E9C|nr:DUF1656 domain-containing protein [uncultured Methylobacterium sp.]